MTIYQSNFTHIPLLNPNNDSNVNVYLLHDNREVQLSGMTHRDWKSLSEEAMVANLIQVEAHKSWVKTKRFSNCEIKESLAFLQNFSNWLLANYLSGVDSKFVGESIYGFSQGKAINKLTGANHTHTRWFTRNEEDHSRIKRFRKVIVAINNAHENTEKNKKIRKFDYGKYHEVIQRMEKLFNDNIICGDFTRYKAGDAYNKAINVLNSKYAY